MPIEYRRGDLLESGADWLTVPVNMKGTMGAGLAKQFKLRFPGLESRYRQACRLGNVELNRPTTVYGAGGASNVILFATKDDWRDPSELKWIAAGLKYLAEVVIPVAHIRSIAIPPLGCGLGGLDWNEVRPLIEQHLGGLNAQILVYEPGRRAPS